MRPVIPVLPLAITLVAAACNSDSTMPPPGNGDDPEAEIFVLNSLSQTISQLIVENDQLVSAGADVLLPANFDGNAFDIFQQVWVTSISSASGSQIVFGSFDTGEQAITGFPDPPGAFADPSRPTMVVDLQGNIGAIVAARGDNSTWLAFPGGATADPLAQDVGRFVERALPAGQVVVSVDANLDDVGGTFDPLGPARLILTDFASGQEVDAFDLPGTTGATDALFLNNELTVLAGGGFTPQFTPAGDGNLVVTDVGARQVIATLALQGNGIHIERGLNSLAYVTRTINDDFDTDVVTFNSLTRTFDRGPTNPIEPVDANGDPVSCWAATALIDSRMLCVSFGFPSVLYFYAADGTLLDQFTTGDGGVDIFVR